MAGNGQKRKRKKKQQSLHLKKLLNGDELTLSTSQKRSIWEKQKDDPAFP